MNKRVSKYTKRKYTILIPKNFGEKSINIPSCLLCGGHGIIPLDTRTTTFGVKMEPTKTYCLCPNGQNQRTHKTLEKKS